MKPRLLKMTAFGPYAGEQIIDFTLLEDANMFLIYGPTGGGKTTILDAICYALYGETNGGERSGESMRSKFAKEDSITEVELYFTLRQEEYRIVRRPQYERAAKRGNKMVQVKSEVEFYKKEGEEFLIISSKYNEVGEKVNELLHFNIGQFRQVIMIAQNKFRELLTVSSKERQQILQDIFETGIYQDVEKILDSLQRQFKEQIREKQFTYEGLLGQIDSLGNSVLQDYLSTKIIQNTPQVCEILVQSCEEKRVEENNLSHALEKTVQALETNQKKLGEVTKKAQDAQEQQKRREELKGLDEQADFYSTLTQRIRLAEQARHVTSQEEIVLRLQKDYESVKEHIIHSTRKLKEEGQKLEDSEQKLKLYAHLPKEIEEDKKVYSLLESYLPKVISLGERVEVKQRLSQQIIQEEEKQKSIVEALVKSKVQVEEIENRLKQKDSLQKQLSDKLVIQKEMEGVLERKKARGLKEKEREDLVKIYRSVAQPLKNKSIELIKFKAEYDEMFEKWIQNQAGELAKSLQENSPCPVCGSLHHPHKAVSEGEAITREMIEELERQNKSLQEEIVQLGEQKSIIEEKGKNLKQIIEDYTKELEGKEYITAQLKESLDSEIKQLEQDLIQLEKLQERRLKVQGYIQELEVQKEKLAQNITSQKVRLGEAVAYIEAIEKDLPKELTNKASLESKLEEVQHLYTQKEVVYKAQVEEVEQLRKTMVTINTVMSESQKRQQVVIEQLNKEEDSLRKILKDSGFESLDEYRLSKMTREDFEQNRERIEGYNRQRDFLLERLKELQEQTRGFSIEELERVQQLQNQLIEQHTNLSVEKQKVTQYTESHEKLISMLKELYEENKEMAYKQQIMEKMSLLAKGKNRKGISFERYIQSSIFEEVLASANKKLKPMTQNRYELYRTDDLTRANAQAGLDIGIIDYYSQENRPVNTLSGGESFMAALALALGLSEVIQRLAGATPLDTLFIDEGFGSLDEEALESAIKVLLNIQDTGRLIGIISHVRELREQIPVGLEITTGINGSKAEFKL